MKVVVIGGGPAGMMAGITSARNGNEVIVLEKMNMLLKMSAVRSEDTDLIFSSHHIRMLLTGAEDGYQYM